MRNYDLNHFYSYMSLIWNYCLTLIFFFEYKHKQSLIQDKNSKLFNLYDLFYLKIELIYGYNIQIK